MKINQKPQELAISEENAGFFIDRWVQRSRCQSCYVVYAKQHQACEDTMTLPTGWNGNPATVGTWPLGDVAGEVITNQLITPSGSGVTPSGTGLSATGTGTFPSSISNTSPANGYISATTDIKNTTTTPPLAKLSEINITDEDNLSETWTIGGQLFFTAVADASFNRKLFRYNPTTNRIVQISAWGTSSAYPLILGVLGDYLYYAQNNASNRRKLYRYNAVTDTITQVVDIRGSTADDITYTSLSIPMQYRGAVVGGKFYFRASSSSTADKIYCYDPTGNTVTRISNIRGSSTDNPQWMTEFDGKLYFSANNASAQAKMFRYDPTAGTIVQVSNTRNSTGADNPRQMTVVGNYMYFVATNNAAFSKMYRLSNTGTLVQISNINSGNHDAITSVVVYGSNLYFNISNNGTTFYLCKYDTTAGTFTRLYANTSGYETALFATNNLLYMRASDNDGSGNTKLFCYNSVDNTIKQKSNIVSNDHDINPNISANFFASNDVFYFNGLNGPSPTGYSKLYALDLTEQTGPALHVRDISTPHWTIIEGGPRNLHIFTAGVASNIFECFVINPATIYYVQSTYSWEQRAQAKDLMLTREELLNLQLFCSTDDLELPDIASHASPCYNNTTGNTGDLLLSSSWVDFGWSSDYTTLKTEISEWVSRHLTAIGYTEANLLLAEFILPDGTFAGTYRLGLVYAGNDGAIF